MRKSVFKSRPFFCMKIKNKWVKIYFNKKPNWNLVNQNLPKVDINSSMK